MDTLISIPFLVGLAYLGGIFLYRLVKWIAGLSKFDRFRLWKSITGRRLYESVKEMFMEALMHRKIFRKNHVLGYMHMSLAFGWFLLIVFGHNETMVAETSFGVSLHKAVFFRYYETKGQFFMSGAFAFTMDLLLLFVLSGLGLAMIKRFKKRLFGLRRTTRMKSGDHIALTSLWLIFPLRLFAESNTAAIFGNGSFLTNSVGKVFEYLANPEMLHLPLWMAYSCVLGFFFVALPNSRYMHIPTELVLIFFRKSGIMLKKKTDTYTDVQVFSCSRCGICLDKCQLSVAGIDDSQSVYLLKNIRNHNLCDEKLFNCLMCGKCQIDCPVGIETVNLRITQRIESTRQFNSSYDYLENPKATKSDVVYFAGCMTHLTPGIITSMKKIFNFAGENVWFMDEEKAPCCGRPLMLAGQYEAARKLIENNSRMILGSGAHTLVVSCPICYKVFKEDYSLQNINVVFHAEYINNLICNQKLFIDTPGLRMIYHDPCELGRGMGMYELPRQLLGKVGNVIPIAEERENAYCCGGSLGNLKISAAETNLLRDQALGVFVAQKPDVLVTACPKCKKTFSGGRQIQVMDISEVVVKVLQLDNQCMINYQHSESYEYT
jgi:Fe-S oxidoreductase